MPCDPFFGTCYPDDVPSEPDYASMDPYAALLAYGAAHPGDMVTDADRAAGYQAIKNQQNSGQGISEWLKKNSTAVYAGAGILVLMAMFGGKRR